MKISVDIFKDSLNPHDGSLNLKKLYLNLYGHFPYEFIYTFSSEIQVDLNKVTDANINEAFPLCIIHRRGYLTGNTMSAASDEVDPDDFMYGKEAYLVIITPKRFYQIDPYGIHFYYDPGDDWRDMLKQITVLLNLETAAPKQSEISLVSYGGGDYYTIESKIEPFTIDIKTNYNDDFGPIYEKTVNFLKQKKSGIVLFNGTFGTGKTSFIKHLITEYPAKYVFITSSIAERLNTPEFISFLMDHKNSIFILEDCEQIIKKRDFNYFNGAISHILNMSDGILSDIFNFKFICTFNDSITSIDPALLRKGRCYAAYEFMPLCKEKTIALLKSLGHKDKDIKDVGPMTLADIYNYEVKIDNQPKQKKIGF